MAALLHQLHYTNINRPANEQHAIALAHAHTHQYLFRCAIVACAKLYMMS